MGLVEVDIDLGSELLPPIIKVFLLDNMVFISMLIT